MNLRKQSSAVDAAGGLSGIGTAPAKSPLGRTGALLRSVSPVWYAGIVFAVLTVLPLLAGDNGLLMRILNFTMLFAMLAMGLNVIVGYTGMLSLGHAAFYGLGSYTSALLMVRLDAPFWVCLLASAALTGLVGFLIAFPCLRVQTDFLSLITIAFASLFTTAAISWVSLTDGPIGIINIPPASIGSFSFNTPVRNYYLCFAFAVLIYLALHNVLNSRTGRAFIAIRDDEICARAQGIDINHYKVLAFVLGTIPAGIAGCLAAHYLRYVSPLPFGFNQSLRLMNMVILGGLGSLPGSVLGAVFFVIAPELIRGLGVIEPGIVGILMILLMLFRPQGIMGSAAYAGEGGLMGMVTRWRQRSYQKECRTDGRAGVGGAVQPSDEKSRNL